MQGLNQQQDSLMFVEFVAKNPHHESNQYPFKYEDGLLTRPLICMFQKHQKHECFCPGEQVSVLNHLVILMF